MSKCKVISSLLILMPLSLGLTACNDEYQAQRETEEAAQNIAEKLSGSERSDVFVSDSKSYRITIDNYTIKENESESGNDTIIVDYTFTNNGDSKASAKESCSKFNLFQGETQLKADKAAEIASSGFEKVIGSGKSISFQKAFKTNSMGDLYVYVEDRATDDVVSSRVFFINY